jgi:type I restriction enzyme M protein
LHNLKLTCDQFLALVEQYLGAVSAECAVVPGKLSHFEAVLRTLRDHLGAFRKQIEAGDEGDAEKRRSLVEAIGELGDASDLYEQDRSSLMAGIEAFRQNVSANLLVTNDQQHTARQVFDPIAEKIKGLIKQVDLLYKLASRATELAGDLATELLSPSGKGMKRSASSSSLPVGEAAFLFPLPPGA